MMVAIPQLWGDQPCVMLPDPPASEAEQNKWEEKINKWINFLASISPESHPTEPLPKEAS